MSDSSHPDRRLHPLCVISDERGIFFQCETIMHARIVFPIALGAMLLAAPEARAQAAAQRSTGDTLRLEVGSPQVDGRVYKPHAALVRIRVGDPKGPVLREWTNELTLGDSAGRPVMRWVTKGQQNTGPNAGTSWELRQTYDAITLKPYAYNSTSSNGAYTRVTIDGNRVRGTRRTPTDTTVQPIDITIDRPGFFAGASDLVPAAVGFKAGAVMIAPVWSPAMTKAESRIFTVVGKERVNVEGTDIEAWKVEERRADHSLYATWWLLAESPYMVYGEVPLPNGQIQRMTEVEIRRDD
jgi:hypothetical protein